MTITLLNKKILFSLCLLLTFCFSNLYAINFDSKIVDKDSINNLINNVSSLRAGSDRIEVVYDFARNFENSPYKLGFSLLDLTRLGGNLYIDGVTKDGHTGFVPKGFLGFSFYDYAIGYQFNFARKREGDEGNFSDVAQSHSLSFGMNYKESFYFNVPISYAFAPSSTFRGNTAFSISPRFGWKFRAGWLNHFAFSVHYGMSFPVSTNNVSKQTPISLGFSIFGDLSILRFDDSPVAVSAPMQIDFRYGVKSRDAYIDATYAYNLYYDLMYDNKGAASTDSIYLNVILPLKVASKFGMIYTSITPKLIYLLRVYKSDFAMSLNYMIEGEISVTAVENFTFGLTANLLGTAIERYPSNIGVQNGYGGFNFGNGGLGGGVDIWGTWRF